jgi:hypothetical protein
MRSLSRSPGQEGAAVLVGTSQYRKEPLLPNLPAVSRNLADLRETLQSPGQPFVDVRTVRNPDHPADVMDPVVAVERVAHAFLVVYVAGHGLLDRSGRLHFALSQSTVDGVEYNALPAEVLRRAVVRSRAKIRVLIVDSCFSGRTSDLMADPSMTLRAQLESSGVAVFTSTSSNEPAFSVARQRNTAFTGLLLSSLREGSMSVRRQRLTLNELYEAVLEQAERAGLPRPHLHTTDGIERAPLFPNPAFKPSSPPPVPSVRDQTPRERREAEVAKVLRDEFKTVLSVDYRGTTSSAWTSERQTLPHTGIQLEVRGKISQEDPWFSDDIFLIYESIERQEPDVSLHWRHRPARHDDDFFDDLENSLLPDVPNYYSLTIVDRSIPCPWPRLDDDPRIHVLDPESLEESSNPEPHSIHLVIEASGTNASELAGLLRIADGVFRRDNHRWTRLLIQRGEGSPAWTTDERLSGLTD